MIAIGLGILAALLLLGMVVAGTMGELQNEGRSLNYTLSTLNSNFVHFLDNRGKVKLADEVVAKLRVFAAREFASITDDPAKAYEDGLRDGTTATAQYVLGELRGEE